MAERRRAGERLAVRRPRERWIKRPARPSQPQPPQPLMRLKPGWPQALTGIALGLAFGIFAAVVTPMLVDRPGIPGFAAGLSFTAGFALIWRGAGGTIQDIRDLFK